MSGYADMKIIENEHDLMRWIDAFCDSESIAIDTEFMRERTYSPKLCLIQVATEKGSVCIDPLAISDLSSLGAMLSNPAIKIIHSCRQDLEALAMRMPVRIRHLYDTQLAAAFCGYGDQISYAALVESLCGVRLPKLHTRANWERRPLQFAHLEYALDDVKYLPALQQKLHCILKQKGRVEWHLDECALAANPSNYRFDANRAWKRIKGISHLDALSQACVKKLVLWREQAAHVRDLPRGWVLPTPIMLKICRGKPSTQKQLAQIDGIDARLVEHSGNEMIAIIRQSVSGTGEDSPPCSVSALSAEQRGQVKKIMRFLEECATSTAISQSLFANRHEIEQFVRGTTDLPLFQGWRAELAGNEVLAHYSEGVNSQCS